MTTPQRPSFDEILAKIREAYAATGMTPIRRTWYTCDNQCCPGMALSLHDQNRKGITPVIKNCCKAAYALVQLLGSTEQANRFLLGFDNTPLLASEYLRENQDTFWAYTTGLRVAQALGVDQEPTLGVPA